MNTLDFFQRLKGAIFGLAVGDALGVPVEFKPRTYLKSLPVQTMKGYGTYNQPAGTWSDDSSMTFCLMESLCLGYNPTHIAENFVRWLYENYWTPHGKVFDSGITTRQGIRRFVQEKDALHAGNNDEYSNGNGSLMRILPLAFYIKNLPIAQRFQYNQEVSSITHGHIRATLCCFFYNEFAINLMNGLEKKEAYQVSQRMVQDFIRDKVGLEREKEILKYVFEQDISQMNEQEIQSSGYVVHTLEASIWSFLTTDKYDEAVLKAINLGEDTDTTGTVTGALAGLYYGYEAIPLDWVIHLARERDIDDLIQRFHQAILKLGEEKEKGEA